MANELLEKQPSCNTHASENAQHPDRSEEMQGPPQIAQQEANRNQIEENPKRPRNAIMRNAALAIDIPNRHFANRSAMPGRQGRNKSMQFAIERHLFQNLAPIGFEGRSEIVNINAAKLRHQPVGAFRRNAAQPEIIDSHFAPATDNVVALGNLLQKHWDIRGIVLQVPIHGDDVFTTSMIEAGSQR